MDQDSKTSKRPGAMAVVLLAFIRIYQLTISFFVGRACRHLPTCSDYAAEAIRRHGAWRGFLLGLFRVLRCNPWGTWGFDPVPERVDGPFALRRLWRAGRKLHSKNGR